MILLRGLAAGAFFAAEAFIPLMMFTQRHLSPTLAGLTLTGGGVSWALGSWLQGRPGADKHREGLIRLGFLLTAMAVAGAALVLIPAVPAWIAAASWAVGGIGMGLMITSISVLMLKLSPPEAAGSNSASLQMSDALGNVLLVGLAGVLFSTFGFAAIFLMMTAVSLLGALISTRTRV